MLKPHTPKTETKVKSPSLPLGSSPGQLSMEPLGALPSLLSLLDSPTQLSGPQLLHSVRAWTVLLCPLTWRRPLAGPSGVRGGRRIRPPESLCGQLWGAGEEKAQSQGVGPRLSSQSQEGTEALACSIPGAPWGASLGRRGRGTRGGRGRASAGMLQLLFS